MAIDTKKAFRWIVGILRGQNIPFRISGGLAAKAYGSQRPLADIDIELQDSNIQELLPFVKGHVVEQPHRYKDAEWDVFCAVLEHSGQRIELIGADSMKIFDKTKQEWVSIGIGLQSVQKEIFGMEVPVIPKAELIAYKSLIRREVDLADIEALLNKTRSCE